MNEFDRRLDEVQWRILDVELRMDELDLARELQRKARSGDLRARDELVTLIDMMRKRRRGSM